MLTIRSKSISLSGDSTVNDQVIFAFQAKINSNNPKEVQFSNWINNHELYKQNRKECNSDYESSRTKYTNCKTRCCRRLKRYE